MPIPVPPWSFDIFPTAKSLNLALYTSDGTADNPNGIAFHSYRPLYFSTCSTAATLGATSGGSQNTLSSTGTAPTTRAIIIYDTAGFYGLFSDQPVSGYYQFKSAVKGSAGDGVTAGGWRILSHFAPIVNKASQTSVSADITGTDGTNISGVRQSPVAGQHSAPFFLDVISTGSVTWSPAVTVRDSSSTSTNLVANTSDSSGETARFYSVWAGVSATNIGVQKFSPAGQYAWTAPPGVTQVTVSAFGGGGGGGAGDASTAGVEFGGGGAGGGEFASDTVGVTPGNTYVVNVGSGGAAGVNSQPPGTGGAGASSSFAGDSLSVTAHGGKAGTGATTSANGAGGNGGQGSSALTAFAGGKGNTGKTGSYGGGGGSSAGTSGPGTNPSDGNGAVAPTGGGPGGNGGKVIVQVLQTATHSVNGSNTLTVSFKKPVQNGNSVIANVIYQGTGPPGQPAPNMTVALSDGANMTSQGFVEQQLSTNLQVGTFDAYNLSGGQTGIKVKGFGKNNIVIIAQMWEVSGLGATPSIDTSNTSSVGGANPTSKYSVSSNTSQAPEFWVGTVGAQETSSFSINPPSSSEKWINTGTDSNSDGGVYSRLLSGYQIASTAGTMKWSGSFSKQVSYGAIVVAYTTSATTAGVAPVVGPGGGGGGGLGSGNPGGIGADGQVQLNWEGASGGGYNTPALPAPWSDWNDQIFLGTTSLADVDINGPTGITDVVNFLSSPPVFRIGLKSSQAITTSSNATVSFAGTKASVDSYQGWNGSDTYTIQRDGLYLFHALVCFAQTTAGSRQAGVIINGTKYWGIPQVGASSGSVNCAKTQIYSLVTGDTVQVFCRQTSGGTVSLFSTNQTRFFMVWLGEQGLPAGNWSPPDTSFRWASGVAGDELVTQFQQHLGNDLGFLVNRPYLLAYQGTAQTSLPVSQFNTVNLDTLGSYVHVTDAGDNYTGWTSGSSNGYTAQVPGWYLMVGEFFTSGGGTGQTVRAGILPTTSGGLTPLQATDYYQQQSSPATTSTVGCGATVFGLQYLLSGETVSPVVSTTFTNPYSTFTGQQGSGANYNSHFEMIWLSE